MEQLQRVFKLLANAVTEIYLGTHEISSMLLTYG